MPAKNPTFTGGSELINLARRCSTDACQLEVISYSDFEAGGVKVCIMCSACDRRVEKPTSHEALDEWNAMIKNLERGADTSAEDELLAAVRELFEINQNSIRNLEKAEKLLKKLTGEIKR